MNLELDEEQRLLQQALDRFLEKRLPFETRRKQNDGAAFLAFWRSLDEELGIAGAGLPEALGGFGGGAEAEMIVAGGLGGALAVTPFVDSFVLSANLLDRLGQAELAADVARGEKLVVVATEEAQTRGDVRKTEARAEQAGEGWALSGGKVAVDWAPQADAVLVPALLPDGELGIFLVEAAALGKGLHPYRLIDDTPSADLDLDGVTLSHDALLASGEDAVAALEAAVARALSAYCAQGAAIAAVMVEDTIAYSKEREQFGAPLASFQALQHRMVDMYLKAQELSAASLLAALKVTDPAAVHAAKATMADALRHIGQEAVQLHGAMGLTEELRVGHYFKRAAVLEHKLGGADAHVARYGALRIPA